MYTTLTLSQRALRKLNAYATKHNITQNDAIRTLLSRTTLQFSEVVVCNKHKDQSISLKIPRKLQTFLKSIGVPLDARFEGSVTNILEHVLHRGEPQHDTETYETIEH
jgi:hypothetical protein